MYQRYLLFKKRLAGLGRALFTGQEVLVGEGYEVGRHLLALAGTGEGDRMHKLRGESADNE